MAKNNIIFSVLSVLNERRLGELSLCYPIMKDIENNAPDIMAEDIDTSLGLEGDKKRLFSNIHIYHFSDTGDANNVVCHPVCGIQTNEANVKTLMQLGYTKALILVVTDSVFSPAGRKEYYPENLFGDLKTGMMGTYKFEELSQKIRNNVVNTDDGNVSFKSTLEYFIYCIDQYRRQCIESEIIKKTVKDHYDIDELVLYRVHDEPTGEEITNYTVELTRIIMGKCDNPAKSRLFIDSNGGMRDFMTILLATVRALGIRGIKPSRILYASLNPDQSGMIPILDKRDNYEIFDVVSGVDEFSTYGRVTKLNQYGVFKKRSASLNNRVFTQLNRLSDAVALCNPYEMLEEMKKFAGLLSDLCSIQIKDGVPCAVYASNDKLLDLIISQIADDFGEDLLHPGLTKAERDSLPEEEFLLPFIRWCCKKGLLQQAVTLFAERTPDYFVKKNILYYEVDYDKATGSIANSIRNRGTAFSREYLFIRQCFLLRSRKKKTKGDSLNEDAYAVMIGLDNGKGNQWINPAEEMDRGKLLKEGFSQADKGLLLMSEYVRDENGRINIKQIDKMNKALGGLLDVVSVRQVMNHAAREPEVPQQKKCYEGFKKNPRKYVEDRVKLIENIMK